VLAFVIYNLQLFKNEESAKVFRLKDEALRLQPSGT
jgi:hypothetical protein